MALSKSGRDREYLNFKDNGDSTTSRFVDIKGGLGGFLADASGSKILFDTIEASYPNATTEVYEYFFLSSLVATVTVVYIDASKQDLDSVVRTLP